MSITADAIADALAASPELLRLAQRLSRYPIDVEYADQAMAEAEKVYLEARQKFEEASAHRAGLDKRLEQARVDIASLIKGLQSEKTAESAKQKDGDEP